MPRINEGGMMNQPHVETGGYTPDKDAGTTESQSNDQIREVDLDALRSKEEDKTSSDLAALRKELRQLDGVTTEQKKDSSSLSEEEYNVMLVELKNLGNFPTEFTEHLKPTSEKVDYKKNAELRHFRRDQDRLIEQDINPRMLKLVDENFLLIDKLQKQGGQKEKILDLAKNLKEVAKDLQSILESQELFFVDKQEQIKKIIQRFEDNFRASL